MFILRINSIKFCFVSQKVSLNATYYSRFSPLDLKFQGRMSCAPTFSERWFLVLLVCFLPYYTNVYNSTWTHESSIPPPPEAVFLIDSWFLDSYFCFSCWLLLNIWISFPFSAIFMNVTLCDICSYPALYFLRLHKFRAYMLNFFETFKFRIMIFFH